MALDPDGLQKPGDPEPVPTGLPAVPHLRVLRKLEALFLVEGLAQPEPHNGGPRLAPFTSPWDPTTQERQRPRPIPDLRRHDACTSDSSASPVTEPHAPPRHPPSWVSSTLLCSRGRECSNMHFRRTQNAVPDELSERREVIGHVGSLESTEIGRPLLGANRCPWKP